jgi:hypothetical protein
MATTITAGNATNGAAISSDNTGILELKSGTGSGTTAVTIGTNQAVTFAAGTTINGITVGRGGGSVATNTAVGASALAATTGSSSNNTAVGSAAGSSLTSGARNTALGFNALLLNTTGTENTAVGGNALNKSTTASNNTALGYVALYETTTGANNTALGAQSLQNNTTASNNTAIGYQAGYSITTGASNTTLGYRALTTNITGERNVAVGDQAGLNATGSYNTFVGDDAGYNATTGTFNTFIGQGSGESITTGSKNSILGKYSGNQGGLDIRTENNSIVLSDGDGTPRFWYRGVNNYFYAPDIYNRTTATAANVTVGSDGGLQRSTSALKYKQEIRDLEEIDISALRPIRYKSKCEGDDQTKDHFGLIADEAAEAGFEELVTRGADGEVEGFQYERLTVVLLKKLQTLDAEFKAYKEAHP